MTKQEIQAIMKIIRPAIIALYGRQTLRLIGFKDQSATWGYPRRDMVYRIVGPDNRLYRVEIERGVISFIEEVRE